VLRIGRYLIVLAVALVAVTAVVSVVRGDAALETLQFALVVTIASVPVALPAVLSVTMAVGSRQLARRQAVVSHLPAVEELGGIDVLCSDKTGTLTQNRLAVAEPWPVPGGDAQALLEAAILASRGEDGDAIDLAIIAAGHDRGVAVSGQVREFTPFDPVAKRTAAVVALPGGGTISVAKGAPQVIAALCAGDAAVDDTNAQAIAFARSGYRSLAVARTDPQGTWRLLGLIPLADPPRPDSAETIARAEQLGIDVKMVTGDQLPIARKVAAQVDLGSDILAADVLDQNGDGGGGSEAEVALVEHADGFAQVFPQHKYRIVQLLQKRGHIVAMTGDGVNDAPALKQADAGIAVAGATDAARAAADVVLLAPGLSVIVDAIRLAREIFARMTSYAMYRIAETIRILLLITIAILAFNFFPVTAIMIVLLAVLNDAAILSIAYDHVRGAERPASWDMRTVLTLATVLGLFGVIASFTLFALADTVFRLDHDVIRTLIYLKLSVAGHLTIFVTRTRGPFWSSPRPSALLTGAVLGTQTLATVIAATGVFMTPIGWTRAGVVWAYALAWFLVNDRVKLVTYRLLDGRRRRGAAAPRARTSAATAS
jgi:H+-transporting ATPase